MKEWTNVCLFIVSDHGISGEVNVLPLFSNGALLNTYACEIGYWDLRGFPLPWDLQCIWWHKGACEFMKAKKGQAKTRK